MILDLQNDEPFLIIHARERRLKSDFYLIENLKRQVNGERLTPEIAENEATRILAKATKRLL